MSPVDTKQMGHGTYQEVIGEIKEERRARTTDDKLWEDIKATVKEVNKARKEGEFSPVVWDTLDPETQNALSMYKPSERINDLTDSVSDYVDGTVVEEDEANVPKFTGNALELAKTAIRAGFYGTPFKDMSPIQVSYYSQGFFARKGNENLIDGSLLYWRSKTPMGKTIQRNTKRTRKSSSSGEYMMGYQRSEKIINLLKQCETIAEGYTFTEERAQTTAIFDYLIDEFIQLKATQESRTKGKSKVTPGNPTLVKSGQGYNKSDEKVQKLSQESVDKLKNKIKENLGITTGKSPSRLPSHTNSPQPTTPKQPTVTPKALPAASDAPSPASTPSMPTGAASKM